MTNLAVVNGPIREEIGMNCGIGAMGPYSHANATIGRAYQLLSQNLQGGSVPDESYMGTLGNPFAYSFCFAENEERSPWEPLHVTKGMKASDSAVSVFFGGRHMQDGFGPRETWQEKMKRCLSAPSTHDSHRSNRWWRTYCSVLLGVGELPNSCICDPRYWIWVPR
jgi:hypothetical protein